MLQLHRAPALPAYAATSSAPRERRRFRRTPLNERIRLSGDGIAPTAEVIDGSAGGLFLRVAGERRPEAGTRLEVAFEAVGGSGPARADRRRSARVVRCLSHAGTHYVALRFDTADALRIHARLG